MNLNQQFALNRKIIEFFDYLESWANIQIL